MAEKKRYGKKALISLIILTILLFGISELYFLQVYVMKAGVTSKDIVNHPEYKIDVEVLTHEKRKISYPKEERKESYDFYIVQFDINSKSDIPPSISELDIETEYQVNGTWYQTSFSKDKPYYLPKKVTDWVRTPDGYCLNYELVIHPFTQNFFGLWKRNRFWEGNYRLLIKLDNGKYIEKTFMIPPCS